MARLRAVQALYQMDIGGAGLDDILGEFAAHRLVDAEDDANVPAADPSWFRAIVRGVIARQLDIDPLIHACLPSTWPLKRIDTTLRAILRCGAYELITRKDVPARVAVSEYVAIAAAFYEREEIGLVNAVLDRLAHDLRGKDRPDRDGSAASS